MDGFGATESSFHEFSLAEMLELEKIYKEMGEKDLGQEFCQELAINFSSSTFRAGKAPVPWEQVQLWFQEKHQESKAKVNSLPNALKLYVDLPNGSSAASNSPKRSPSPKGTKVADLSELQFEARSSKDYAWYDVGSFLSYRVVSSGELDIDVIITSELDPHFLKFFGNFHKNDWEVRVRFAGFGFDQDEWVNVKEAVRERSIPLEPSECHKVKVGDLMLCFRERDDYAVYSDAYVVHIQRRIHDPTGCRCIFIVRYEYDDSEEEVQWNRLCCRPAQEESVFSLNPCSLNPIASLWG